MGCVDSSSFMAMS
uniref:Uncharacterized protein n=1 Tax=Arundo donax TaxID=35708 RepID=A0A0A9EL57_ARUDO